MDQEKWDSRFIQMAQLVSEWSKDPGTKCGCVIVQGKVQISTGFNGYPSGIKDDVTDDRDTKLIKTLHSEMNAIIYAGESVKGATLYVTPMPPCAQCAAFIIQAKIVRVVAAIPCDKDLSKWLQSFRTAEQMFNEAGVKLEKVII